MGKIIKFILLILLLVLPLASRIASMPVPAVFSTHGAELVRLEVEVREGTGEVYVATKPLIGTQTQSSARTAFNVSRRMAGVGNNYDALIRLREPTGSKSVDGPSAGAAMTLLMLSIFENTTIRDDLTMTGTISDDGFVGEVGGVGEKTKAAVDEGMKVILIPRNSEVFDKMVFSILGKRWNISIVEVSNISEAANLAFGPKNVLQSNVMEVKPKLRVNLTTTEISCADCHIDEFKALASSIMNENRALLDEVSKQNRSEFSYFIRMIEADIEEAENAEKWNYPYTGANSAFLTAINLNFLKDSNITYDLFRSRMFDVDRCIKSANRPQITKDNFEWVVGGDERLAWSRKKFYEVFNQNDSSNDEETMLLQFKELLTAESWCKVSHEMFSVANRIGGTPVNESNLKTFAAGKIAEAEEKLKSFGDTDFGDVGWRFEAAKDEFSETHFAAAIFDSDYLIGTIASLNRSEDFDSFLNSEFNSSKSWNGMWAALYGNHAKYIYLKSKATSGTTSSPVMLEKYANLLDSDTVKMRELFGSSAVEPAAEAAVISEQPIQYEGELALLLVFCIIIAIFLNLVQIFKTAE
jgi:predicted S18 family serine protease